MKYTVGAVAIAATVVGGTYFYLTNQARQTEIAQQNEARRIANIKAAAHYQQQQNEYAKNKPTVVPRTDGIYRDEKYAIQLQYPTDWQLTLSDQKGFETSILSKQDGTCSAHIDIDSQESPNTLTSEIIHVDGRQLTKWTEWGTKDPYTIRLVLRPEPEGVIPPAYFVLQSAWVGDKYTELSKQCIEQFDQMVASIRFL